jgi:hypothetical protein
MALLVAAVEWSRGIEDERIHVGVEDDRPRRG